MELHRIKMLWAAQNACTAQLVQGKFIKRVDANLVLDVAFWVFQEGTAVNWVGGGSDGRTYLNGGGRDFRVNPDGSICLVNHPHLCLGVFDPENVDRYSGPRSDGLLSTDEISGNYCCCCFPLGFGATTVMPHGPDVIEQWSVWKWCWFTTGSRRSASAAKCAYEIRARIAFGTGKIPTTRTTFARRASNGPSCLCKTGSRTPLAFQLVDTKDIEGSWCCCCWMHIDRLVLLPEAGIGQRQNSTTRAARGYCCCPCCRSTKCARASTSTATPRSGFYGPTPTTSTGTATAAASGTARRARQSAKANDAMSPPGACMFPRLELYWKSRNSPAAGPACPPSARARSAAGARVRVGPPLEALARRDAVGRPDDAAVVFFRRGRGRQTDGLARGDLSDARRRQCLRRRPAKASMMVHVRDVMGKLIGRQARALQRSFEIRTLKTRSQESQPRRQAAHHVGRIGGPVRGACSFSNQSHVIGSHGFLILGRVRPLAHERLHLGHDERVDRRLREEELLLFGRRSADAKLHNRRGDGVNANA